MKKKKNNRVSKWPRNLTISIKNILPTNSFQKHFQDFIHIYIYLNK